MKKLHTNHKLYLLKPVTLVGASYFVCVCVCVYLVEHGRKQQ